MPSASKKALACTKKGTDSTVARHPWHNAEKEPSNDAISFLKKELKLDPVQVKILNWLKKIAKDNFNFTVMKARESSSLTITIPSEYTEHIDAVMVSLGFSKTTKDPWCNKWTAKFGDEDPVATINQNKGEIDIQKLPYRAPKEKATPRAQEQEH